MSRRRREANAVDAILQIAVLVAHMQFTACGGILRHARRLQQHLVQTGVRALRQCLDRLLIQLICAGAEGRQNILPCRIERLICSATTCAWVDAGGRLATT